MKKTWIVVLVILMSCVVTTYLLNGNIQYIWWESMIYYMIYIDMMKDVLNVVDYLKVGLPHHTLVGGGGGGLGNK